MAPNSDISWKPSAGRHQINIGSSLGRALRARKSNAPGQQPAKRNVLPEREFYSVRYGFKPSLIDSTKPGSLQVRRGKDASSNSVTVEHASSQPGELYSFPGNEVASKEWTCVLIYDEETGGYTLEKLESSIALGPPEKRAGTTRPSRSPSDSPPDSAAASTTVTADADADFEEILPESLLSSKPTPMVVDDDEEDIPLKTQVKAAPPAERPQKPLPQKSRSDHSSTKTSITKSSSAVKPKKALKRSTPTFSDAEEETLAFGRPTKRKVSPPIPAPEPRRGPSPSRLELPGMSSSYAPLPSLSITKSASSSSLTSRTQPSASSTLQTLSPILPSAASDSEDEDWDEFAAPLSTPSIAPAPVPVAVAAEDEGGEEIDVDEFENLMNAQMNEAEDDEPEQDSVFPDDDFLALAIAPEEQTPLPPRGPPISLKQLAGGVDSGDEEEDYSSSDDSDED